MYFKAIIIILTSIGIIFAQNDRRQGQTIGFDKGYFSGSYNLYPSFIEKINNEVKDFGVDEFDKNLFMYGGELCGNMNPAFGIGIQYYFGNDLSQKIVELSYDTLTVELDRAVRYDVSFFGLIINYRKSLLGPIEFFGSLSANYGSVELILSQDRGDQSFGDMWSSFDPESELDKRFNKSVSYNSDLYIFSANNGIRFYASSRIAVGITVGYSYGFVSDKGEINYEFESIKNVPDLDFKGMNYGLGVYFGY
ncbi:MAG: hypothetical protein KKD38_10325 [Candidatus Delongbacteria bacterium]|nr:hypothetical protein [Candidatus Delongbacteria bacterium]MCG2761344.1 hypothetical protein [Candidatus Delongbacteria bacterium]